MMLPTFLIYDTETSGFYKKGAEKLKYKDQPWIVQIGLILCTRDKEYHKMSFMINSVGREIHPGAEKVHGISVEMTRTGFSEISACEILGRMLANTTFLVCHNINFDVPMTELLFRRNGLEQLAQLLNSTPAICTMKESTNFCALPGRWAGSFKWPKLEELHNKLYGFTPPEDELHDALGDVIYTKKCLFELIDRGIIELPEVTDGRI